MAAGDVIAVKGAGLPEGWRHRARRRETALAVTAHDAQIPSLTRGHAMNFVTWSIRNPVPVIMMFVALVVGGIISFPKLGVQNQPDITFPFISVERGLRRRAALADGNRGHAQDRGCGLDHRRHREHQLHHHHRLSQTIIEFQFGSDLSQAMDDVRDAVGRIRPDLPLDATEPFIARATTAGNAVLTFAVASDNLTDTELSWFVDLNVMREISGVDGVGAGQPHRRRVARSARGPGSGPHGRAGRDRRRCLQPAGAHAGGAAGW